MAEVAGQHLARGTRISRYEVLDTLGAGGFGITYKAYDTQLQCEVAVKEYLPVDLAARDSDHSTVLPRSREVADEYRHGLTRFLDEARVLAKFKNRHIVRVSDYMEVNGTAYLVMDYEEGQPLSALLAQRGGPLPEVEIKNIFLPILDGLKAVHDAGLLHRDIKPDNIYLRRDGPPVLLDFGAARQYAGTQTRAVTAVITPGYAAFEQYQLNGELGAWTDLYAIGGTMYTCITGKPPIDAITRHPGIKVDPLQPAVEAGQGQYSEVLLRSIDWMLRPAAHERPQSVDAVLPCIQGRTEPPVPGQPVQPQPAGAGSTVRLPMSETVGRPANATVPIAPVRPTVILGRAGRGGRRAGLIAGIAALLLIAAGAGWWYVHNQHEKQLAIQMKQEQARKQQLAVQEQIDAAQRAIAAGRYTVPADDNALSHLRAAMKLDPTNVDARAGMDKLFAALLSASKHAAESAELKAASEYLNGAAQVYPGDPALQTARDLISKEKAKRQAKLEAEQTAPAKTQSGTEQAAPGGAGGQAVVSAGTSTPSEAEAPASGKAGKEAPEPAAQAASAPTPVTPPSTARASTAGGKTEGTANAGTTKEAQGAEKAPAAAQAQAASASTAGSHAGVAATQPAAEPAQSTKISQATQQTQGTQAAQQAQSAQQAQGSQQTQAAEQTQGTASQGSNAQTQVTQESSGTQQAQTQGAEKAPAAGQKKGGEGSQVATAQPAAGSSTKTNKVTENVNEFIASLTSGSDKSGGDTTVASANEGAGTANAASSEVARLLKQAEQYMAASNLVSPEGHNARMVYQQVLAMDAHNTEARAGMNRIGDVYEKAAAVMLDQGQTALARRIIERGLAAVPSHPGLLALQARLPSQ